MQTEAPEAWATEAYCSTSSKDRPKGNEGMRLKASRPYFPESLVSLAGISAAIALNAQRIKTGMPMAT